MAISGAVISSGAVYCPPIQGHFKDMVNVKSALFRRLLLYLNCGSWSIQLLMQLVNFCHLRNELDKNMLPSEYGGVSTCSCYVQACMYRWIKILVWELGM